NSISSMHRSITVPEDAGGQRLDRFLASILGDLSRSQIQRLIKDEQIQVGNHGVRPNYVVRPGEEITVAVSEPAEPLPKADALPLSIVYEDQDLIVIDKPAGMVVHPAAGHASGTLVNALLHHVTDLSGIGGERRPGIVHRLDRGTSGLMVVAKHDASHDE